MFIQTHVFVHKQCIKIDLNIKRNVIKEKNESMGCVGWICTRSDVRISMIIRG